MLTSFFKVLILLTSLDISAWQSSIYNQLVSAITSPLYPQTSVQIIDDETIGFSSYAAFYDPGDKYQFVMHDIATVPTWLFIMRKNGKKFDELWHRGLHHGIICNTLDNNKILLHAKTIGFFKLDILVRVSYQTNNTNIGAISIIEMDKSFSSEKINDFGMIVWSFPHPRIRNLVIIVTQGYIKTGYPVGMLKNNVKWHIDNALLNFGERLLVIMK